MVKIGSQVNIGKMRNKEIAMVKWELSTARNPENIKRLEDKLFRLVF